MRPGSGQARQDERVRRKTSLCGGSRRAEAPRQEAAHWPGHSGDAGEERARPGGRAGPLSRRALDLAPAGWGP